MDIGIGPKLIFLKKEYFMFLDILAVVLLILLGLVFIGWMFIFYKLFSGVYKRWSYNRRIYNDRRD